MNNLSQLDSNLASRIGQPPQQLDTEIQLQRFSVSLLHSLSSLQTGFHHFTSLEQSSWIVNGFHIAKLLSVDGSASLRQFLGPLRLKFSWVLRWLSVTSLVKHLCTSMLRPQTFSLPHAQSVPQSFQSLTALNTIFIYAFESEIHISPSAFSP